MFGGGKDIFDVIGLDGDFQYVFDLFCEFVWWLLLQGVIDFYQCGQRFVQVLQICVQPLRRSCWLHIVESQRTFVCISGCGIRPHPVFVCYELWDEVDAFGENNGVSVEFCYR